MHQRYRTPITRVPAPSVIGVKPKLAEPEPVAPLRPRRQPAPSAVKRERPAARQGAPVDADSVSRNRDHIAGDGGDNLQEQLGIGWARSRGKVSAAPAEISGAERCAHRDEGTALNSTLRYRSVELNAHELLTTFGKFN